MDNDNLEKVIIPINDAKNILELMEEQRQQIIMLVGAQHTLCELMKNGNNKGTGEWKWISDDEYRCSECGNKTSVDECMEEPQYLFCPYCGRKMTFAGKYN